VRGHRWRGRRSVNLIWTARAGWTGPRNKPEAQTAIVEPGVILAALIVPPRLRPDFRPGPASTERATMELSQTRHGAHSILYWHGRRPYPLRRCVMAVARWRPGRDQPDPASCRGHLDLETRRRPAYPRQNAEAIRSSCKDLALAATAGYLLPWSHSRPPQWASANPGVDQYPAATPEQINMATLLAGGGTLAVMQRITLNLVPRPSARAGHDYPSVAEACDDVPRLLGDPPP
jgi:hypothetical protein